LPLFNNPEELCRAPFAALQAGNGSIVPFYLPPKALLPLAAAQMALGLLLFCYCFACKRWPLRSPANSFNYSMQAAAAEPLAYHGEIGNGRAGESRPDNITSGERGTSPGNQRLK